METQVWCPAVSSVEWGGGAEKEQWHLQQFCLAESCPTPESLPYNKVPPHLSLVPFKLLPQHWSSEGVGLCIGPWEELLGILEALHLIQPQSLLVFIARSYGDLSFLLWNPGLGYLVWAVSPRCSEVPPQPRYLSLLILNYHTHVWDQPVMHLCPSYQSPCGFFKSLVVVLPFS